MPTQQAVLGVMVFCVISSMAFLSSRLPAYGLLQKEKELTEPREILNLMAKTYAECRSYEDSGMITSVHIAKFRHTKYIPFSTAFVRGGAFRFEYKTRHGEADDEFFRYIVWAKDKQVKSWWDLTGLLEEGNALSGAMGGSVAGRYVPGMLFPKLYPGSHLKDLKDPRRIDDGKIGEQMCFRIQGLHLDTSTTLWIDKKTTLIRKIESKRKFADFEWENTVTYEATVNGKIADKKLEFNPPARK